MSIKDWLPDERPREKLLDKGASVLSDAELLAILLRTGTKGLSAVELARSLLQSFGSLGALFSATMVQLSAHKGMGQATFSQFSAVREIGKRLLAEQMLALPILSSPEAVSEYLRLHIGFEKIEVMLGLFLNQQNRVIAVSELSRGTVAENTVYIREIAKSALEKQARSLIIAHNHPAGSIKPSSADINFTQRLKQALDLLDIQLLDHVIVTSSQTVSLREYGYF